MTRYWPSSFFRVFIDQVEVVVNNKAKQKKEQYLAVLTVQVSVNKGFVIWSKREFFLWDQRGKPRARSGDQSELRIRLILRIQPFNK